MEFPNPHTELSWLIETQKQELASLPEEFRANGLTASSLSSSYDLGSDDDKGAADISAESLEYVPMALDPVTLGALLRRIEWEKFVKACSTTTHIYLAVGDTGAKEIRTNDRRLKPSDLMPYARRLGRLDIDAVYHARHLAHVEPRIVWDNMNEHEKLAWTARAQERWAYVNQADDNTSRIAFDYDPPVSNGGPQEFGLDGDTLIDWDTRGNIGHTLAEDSVPTEPSEFDLWPLSETELEFGITPIELFITRSERAWYDWAHGTARSSFALGERGDR